MKVEKSLLSFLNNTLPKLNQSKITNLDEFMDVKTDKILNDFYKYLVTEVDLDEYNFGCDEMAGVSHCIKLFIQQDDISYENKLLGLILFHCINEEDYDIIELMKHRWATLYVINCMLFYSHSAQAKIGIHSDIIVSIANAICTLQHNYEQEYTLLDFNYE